MDAGYGFALPGNGGVLTPYTGMALGEAVRAGARWELGPDAVLGLEATRQEGAAEADHQLTLRAALRF